MKKCFERRNTVACAGNENTNDEINASLSIAKNTDYQKYYKNSQYQNVCLYCTDKFIGSLVQHYVKSHSDLEVPISRISPEMARRLQNQVENFKKDKDDNKVTGFCYFCEKTICGLKVTWQR